MGIEVPDSQFREPSAKVVFGALVVGFKTQVILHMEMVSMPVCDVSVSKLIDNVFSKCCRLSTYKV